MGDFVHALDEVDRVKIFAAAELVGNPLAGYAGIVEIEHGGNGVHAEAVNVVLVQPQKRVGNQIVLNFVAAVVVGERAPIGVRTLARVGVLVEMGAIELREPVGVAGKMRGG